MLYQWLLALPHPIRLVFLVYTFLQITLQQGDPVCARAQILCQILQKVMLYLYLLAKYNHNIR